MKAATLDRLVWPCIFGGILLFSFGWSLPDHATGIGWTLVVVGAALVAVGVVLIVWRSRLNDQDP